MPLLLWLQVDVAQCRPFGSFNRWLSYQETIARHEAAKAHMREVTPICERDDQTTPVHEEVAVSAGDLLPHSVDIMIQVQMCFA